MNTDIYPIKLCNNTQNTHPTTKTESEHTSNDICSHLYSQAITYREKRYP